MPERSARSPRWICAQIDLVVLEALGGVDRHHRHRVAETSGGRASSASFLLFDRALQAAERASGSLSASSSRSRRVSRRSTFARPKRPRNRAAASGSGSSQARRRSIHPATGSERNSAAQPGDGAHGLRERERPAMQSSEPRDPVDPVTSGTSRKSPVGALRGGRCDRPLGGGDACGTFELGHRRRESPARQRGIQAASGTPTRGLAAGRRPAPEVRRVEHGADGAGQIDDFAAAIVGAVPLHGVGNSGATQRVEVDLERLARPQQDGEAAPRLAGEVVQLADLSGDRRRLDAVRPRRLGRFAAREIDRVPGRASARPDGGRARRNRRLRRAPVRRERLEARLDAGLGDHDRCDRASDLVEHRRHRAEVDRQAGARPSRRLHAGEKRFVGGEVGLAPGVDRPRLGSPTMKRRAAALLTLC